MFIRRTQTRNTATGERYFTFRLVQSKRVGGKVKQQTLLNLGRHFEVDQGLWPHLCRRLDDLLSGQAGLDHEALPAGVERQAQRIGAQLLARSSASHPDKPAEQTTEADTVHIDTLQLLRPRTVGVEAAGLWALRQIDFIGLLGQLGLNGPQCSAAVGAIIGRMAQPGSELSTHEWLRERSGLGELLGVDYEAISLSSLYRIADRLLAIKKPLEEQLFERVSDLFGLGETVTLYDLTNTYFEGEAGSNPKARRGRSKEKRSDCPLLTLGLVLDGSGFVRRSEVFEGNVSEGKTLEQMLIDLKTPTGALVVMDRGIATEDNLTWLRRHGYRYLVVSRERKRAFDAQRATAIDTASGECLHLEKTLSEAGDEVRLYCFSESRAHKESGIQQRFTQRFEQALDKIAEGLNRPRTCKKIDKLWERIGRLKEKSRGVGQHYRIELIPDEQGIHAQALRYQRSPVEGSSLTHPGVYSLRSSETEWDEEKLWRTYIMLTDLEAVFRSLKSELGLRPIYHHKEARADAHLFITVLAYQMVQIIRKRLSEHQMTASWSSMRRWMSSQVRVTATFQQGDGRTLHVRKATLPEGKHLEVCRLLGIDRQPGALEKLVH